MKKPCVKERLALEKKKNELLVKCIQEIRKESVRSIESTEVRANIFSMCNEVLSQIDKVTSEI